LMLVLQCSGRINRGGRVLKKWYSVNGGDECGKSGFHCQRAALRVIKCIFHRRAGDHDAFGLKLKRFLGGNQGGATKS
jgi:hypothetical protein